MDDHIDILPSENMVARRTGRTITLLSSTSPPASEGRLIFAGQCVAAGANWFEVHGKMVEFTSGGWNPKVLLTSADISPSEQLKKAIHDSMDGLPNLLGCQIGLGLVKGLLGSSQVQFSNMTSQPSHVQFFMAQNPGPLGVTLETKRVSTVKNRWRLPKWLSK